MTAIPKRNTKREREFALANGLDPARIHKILARWRRMGATVEEIQLLAEDAKKHQQ